MFGILPPASLILIIIYIFFVFPSGNYPVWKKCLLLHVLCVLFFQTGYFINIGSISFSHAEVTLFVCVASIFLSGARTFFTQKNFGLFAIVLIGWVFCVFFPSDYPSVPVGVYWTYSNAITPTFSLSFIKYLFRLALFFVVANTSMIYIEDDDIRWFSNYVVKIEKVVLVIIAFEFVTKNVMNSAIVEEFKRFFFGYITTDAWQNPDIFYRGGQAALSGLFFEPSAFAWSQLLVGIIVIKSDYSRKKLMSIVIIAFQLLSVSFSAALTVLCLTIFLILENSVGGAIFFIIIGCVSIFAFVSIGSQAGSDTLWGYYYERIFQSLDTLKVLQANSNINEMQQEMRLVSIAESLKSFLKRPLFGIGLGTNYSYSLIPTALANIGIIGFTFWIGSINTIINAFRSHRRKIDFIVLFVVYFFIGTIGSLYDLSLLSVMIVLANHKQGGYN